MTTRRQLLIVLGSALVGSGATYIAGTAALTAAASEATPTRSISSVLPRPAAMDGRSATISTFAGQAALQ